MASKSLDFNNLYQQSFPVKLLVCILIPIVILVFGYIFFYKEQYEAWQSKKADEDTLRAEYTKKVGIATKLPILTKELEELQAAFALLLKQLPTDAEVPNLIQELNQAGSNNSLQMTNTTPQPVKPDGPVEILPYAISTKGSYEQLSKFAKDVGGLSRIVVLDNLNVSADKDGKLLFKANANTYKAAENWPPKEENKQ